MSCSCKAQCRAIVRFHTFKWDPFDSCIMQKPIYKGALQGFSKSKSCESHVWVKQLIIAVLIKQGLLEFSLVLGKQS